METTQNKNRFEIEQDYYNLCHLLEESEGEVTPEIEKLLSINGADIENSFKRYHRFIQQYKAASLITKDELERLKSRLDSQDKFINRIKNKAIEALNVFGEVGKSGNRSLKFPELTVFTKDNNSLSTNELFDLTINKYIDPLVFESIPDEIEALNELGSVNITIKCSIEDFYDTYGDIIRSSTESDNIEFNYKLDANKVKKIINDDNSESFKDLGIYVESKQSVTFK